MKKIRLSVKLLKKIKEYSEYLNMEDTLHNICVDTGLLDIKNKVKFGTYHQHLRIEHLYRGVLFVFYAQNKLTKKQKKAVIKYLEIGSTKQFDRSKYFGRRHSKKTIAKIRKSVRKNRYHHDE